jgi:hypothetical protein
MFNSRRRHQEKVRNAYRALFDPEVPVAETVMRDLAAICCANTPTEVTGDTHATAHNNGKRRVFLHIKSQLAMTDERLDTLYGLDEQSLI